jgi:hypothetical protein
MKWIARNSPEIVKTPLKLMEVSPDINICLDERESIILRVENNHKECTQLEYLDLLSRFRYSVVARYIA